MRGRRDLLTSTENMGTSGTLVWNLDYSDPITRIILRFTATNGALTNYANPVERNISKIEIVDGSEVLWSLAGDIAYALFNTLRGGRPLESLCSVGGAGQSVTIPIEFGMGAFDPDLAFNPAAFRNPQLKVTFDEATVRAAASDGYSSDSFNVTVIVVLMEDTPVPFGYLKGKDIYEYTSLDSGDTIVDMPTDDPYRFLLLRVYEAGQAWTENMENVKLNCDGGKFIPLDLSLHRLSKICASIFPSIEKSYYHYVTATQLLESWLGEGQVTGAFGHAAAYMTIAQSHYLHRFRCYSYQDDGSAGAGQSHHFGMSGHFPHNTLVVPFGRIAEVDDAFPAPSFNSVKLVLTNGDAGAEVNVGVQQIHRY